jgi:hypothetical protein
MGNRWRRSIAALVLAALGCVMASVASERQPGALIDITHTLRKESPLWWVHAGAHNLRLFNHARLHGPAPCMHAHMHTYTHAHTHTHTHAHTCTHTCTLPLVYACVCSRRESDAGLGMWTSVLAKSMNRGDPNYLSYSSFSAHSGG